MQLVINIPDAVDNRFIKAVAAHFNYQDNIMLPEGGMQPNPETKRQFVKRLIGEMIRGMAVQSEIQDAQKTARDAAALAAADITVTVA